VGRRVVRGLLVLVDHRLLGARPVGLQQRRSVHFTTLSIYGPDLDRLWAKVRPILETYDARPAYAELRDGGPDQLAKRVDLGPVPTSTTSP
jgi:hypothetical protein